MLEDLLHGGSATCHLGRGEPPVSDRLEPLPLCTRRVIPAFDGQDVVYEDVEGPGRRDAGIQLPERAGGRVPRVREGGSIGLHQALVQLLEGPDSHDDLTSKGEEVGHRARVLAQPEGHRRDRAHVLGDPLTTHTVAASRRPHEDARLVDELDGSAVQLRLQDVFRKLDVAEATPHSIVEPAEGFLVRGRVEAEHLDDVVDRREALERRGAHALGRGVGRSQLRKALLELLQLAEESVVFLVGDLRRVLHKVEVRMAPESLAQLLDALLGAPSVHVLLPIPPGEGVRRRQRGPCRTKNTSSLRRAPRAALRKVASKAPAAGTFLGLAFSPSTPRDGVAAAGPDAAPPTSIGS